MCFFVYTRAPRPTAAGTAASANAAGATYTRRASRSITRCCCCYYFSNSQSQTEIRRERSGGGRLAFGDKPFKLGAFALGVAMCLRALSETGSRSLKIYSDSSSSSSSSNSSSSSGLKGSAQTAAQRQNWFYATQQLCMCLRVFRFETNQPTCGKVCFRI